jgi:hypothetical protein
MAKRRQRISPSSPVNVLVVVEQQEAPQRKVSAATWIAGAAAGTFALTAVFGLVTGDYVPLQKCVDVVVALVTSLARVGSS